MTGWNAFGKLLISLGVMLVIIGGIIAFFGKFTGLGRLPGDIYIQKGNFSFYFPIVTCLILSIILSLIFTFFGRR